MHSGVILPIPGKIGWKPRHHNVLAVSAIESCYLSVVCDKNGLISLGTADDRLRNWREWARLSFVEDFNVSLGRIDSTRF